MQRSRAPKKPIVYKSAEFAVTDSSSESEEESHGFNPTNRLHGAQGPVSLAENDRSPQILSGMPSRSKTSTKTVGMNATMSKKRPLSPCAASSAAKRSGTQAGFVLSSDEDDERKDGGANDCHAVPSKSAHQQKVVPPKISTSTQETLPSKLTKGPLPTKQLNKARLNAILGKIGSLKKTTRKTLPPNQAIKPVQWPMDPAASHEPADLSKSPRGNAVHHSEEVGVSGMFGKSLLGVKRTDALCTMPESQDAVSKTDETRKPFSQETCPFRMRSSPKHSAPGTVHHPQPIDPEIYAVAPRNTSPQQHKSLLENNGTAGVTSNAKDEGATSTARPVVGIDKEQDQRQFPPASGPKMMQMPIKDGSWLKNIDPSRVMASCGSYPGLKAQDLSKSKTKTPQPEYQNGGNKSKPEPQISEINSNSPRPSKPESLLSKQQSQEGTPETDPDVADDDVAAVLGRPVVPLPSDAISLRIDQESLEDTDTVSEGPETASGAAENKLSLPSTSGVISDVTMDVSSKILALSQSSKISEDAQPYFEYSIFQTDWSSEQGENEASTKEITVRPFNDIYEANTQAERLFQSRKYSSYMIVEYSTKRDEHGCMVLTSIVAPSDYPTHRYYTKIYVRRDCVSKFANRTSQALKGTAFISDTGYVLRLFRLIEMCDTDSSDSSDSDSDSPKAAANKPVRAYLPHSRPEVYTTLEAANRAAKNLQIELSHERNPKDATTKAFQEQDLRNLNIKLFELESAEHDEDRCWQSKFNTSGLGGDNLELVVEKVGICGPRNI